MRGLVLYCEQIRGTQQRLVGQDLLVSIARAHMLLYAEETIELFDRRGLTARYRRNQVLVIAHVIVVVEVKVVDHRDLVGVGVGSVLHVLNDLVVIGAQWVEAVAAPFN